MPHQYGWNTKIQCTPEEDKMIAQLSGTLTQKAVEHLIVSVGGVGYEVHVPLSTFYSIPEEGQDVELLIYTHVKEDVLKLFGFLTPSEKDLFKKLIGVSGVGPKLALNILSGIESNDLAGAIKNSDIARLNAIPGVGKKTAERLILELKDKIKLDDLTAGKDTTISTPSGGIFDDALSALINLGYKKGDVEKTLDTIVSNDDSADWAVEKLLKEALKMMAK
jgi:Holliday junction DNA helicase RuvA